MRAPSAADPPSHLEASWKPRSPPPVVGRVVAGHGDDERPFGPGDAAHGRRHLAAVELRHGDVQEHDLRRVFDNPNDFDANLYLGILLRQDKMFDEAFGYLSRAVQLRPREQYARYHLGAVLAALGKPNEARPLLEGVAKEYPDFAEARALLASVYYRLNRKEDGDRERAIVQKLSNEQQAKQPGAQNGVGQTTPVKSP